VVPPESETDDDNETIQDKDRNYDSDEENESNQDVADKKTMEKLAKNFRKERDDWSDEDDIPLWALSKRLKTIENDTGRLR
jgi:hypothetical protein